MGLAIGSIFASAVVKRLREEGHMVDRTMDPV